MTFDKVIIYGDNVKDRKFQEVENVCMDLTKVR